MSQANPWSHSRTCPGKVAYATKDAARAEAVRGEAGRLMEERDA